MTTLIERLLPKTETRSDRARAALVLVTCAAVFLALLAMILFWVFTGALEDIETIIAAAVLTLLLAGIVLLNRGGKSRLALWILTVLLAILALADTSYYGVGVPSAAEFLIPIILATCGAGLWAGLSLALVGSLGMWLIAWAGSSGLAAWIPANVSALSFGAPFLTILFFLVAVLVGIWGREMGK